MFIIVVHLVVDALFVPISDEVIGIFLAGFLKRALPPVRIFIPPLMPILFPHSRFVSLIDCQPLVARPSMINNIIKVAIIVSVKDLKQITCEKCLAFSFIEHSTRLKWSQAKRLS